MSAKRHRLLTQLALLALTASTLCLPACYERIVSANGIGSNYADVKRGYRSDTAADRAVDNLFNSPKPSSRAQRWADPDSNDRGTR